MLCFKTFFSINYHNFAAMLLLRKSRYVNIQVYPSICSASFLNSQSTQAVLMRCNTSPGLTSINNSLTVFKRHKCRYNNYTFLSPGVCLHYTSCLLAVSKTINCIHSRYNYSSSRFTIEDHVYSSFLQSLLEEYKELSNTVLDQTVEPEKFLRFMFLRGASQSIQKLMNKQAEVKELQTMLNVEDDKDMKLLIGKEINRFREEVQQLEDELISVLAGEDPADNRDVILEISAGVGGQEAMLFCADLFAMYRSYASFKGWSVTGLSNEENDIGGSRKATIEVNGEAVYKHLKHEAGVHRVQRVPKTEKAGRIHTSTVTVSVLPQPSEIDIDIQQKDLKIDTFRCGGPGGQHVNKTDSAVRVTHLPTGTVSECRQERSQIKNKEIAIKNLKIKLYQAVLEEDENKRRKIRKLQIGSRGRSEKIRTYNFQQDRITDHRSKEDFSNLPEFMIGGEGLDDLVNSLLNLEKRQVLESMVDSYVMELNKQKNVTTK